MKLTWRILAGTGIASSMMLLCLGILTTLAACGGEQAAPAVTPGPTDEPKPSASPARTPSTPGSVAAPTVTRIPLPISTPGFLSSPEPTVSTRSEPTVPLGGASNQSSEGDSAEFGLEEFPHFPVAAIVRVSSPVGPGSGFIFLTRDDMAFVMTNAHVVDGPSRITVRVQNAEEYDAVLLGRDPLVDLAILSMCCSDSFEHIPLGDGLRTDDPAPWSDNTNIASAGADLVVVGYPLGSYELVATTGKIRTWIDTAEGRKVIHDADTEPGNSGSPILSPDGRLMGVHFAGSIQGEEYSYMVPFEEAEYWSSQWLPGSDPAGAAVPDYQGDVAIRFTSSGTSLLAAASSFRDVPKRTFWIEMEPDTSGWEWYFFNHEVIVAEQGFFGLANFASNWKHEDVNVDSFAALLGADDEGNGGVQLDCVRSSASDDWSTIFTCSRP